MFPSQQQHEPSFDYNQLELLLSTQPDNDASEIPINESSPSNPIFNTFSTLSSLGTHFAQGNQPLLRRNSIAAPPSYTTSSWVPTRVNVERRRSLPLLDPHYLTQQQQQQAHRLQTYQLQLQPFHQDVTPDTVTAPPNNLGNGDWLEITGQPVNQGSWSSSMEFQAAQPIPTLTAPTLQPSPTPQSSSALQSYTTQHQLHVPTPVINPTSKKCYPCPHAGCTKVFLKSHNLKSHLKVHDETNRVHHCPHCDLKFRRSHDLKRHIRLHTNEKPFQCENCGKSFARSDALGRHKKMPGCNPSNPFVNNPVLSPISMQHGQVPQVNMVSSLLPAQHLYTTLTPDPVVLVENIPNRNSYVPFPEQRLGFPIHNFNIAASNGIQVSANVQ